ncbi:hypothetical protein GCM10009754_78930 [Amycolatopsis minnesotensis]|uniref:Uncharacterized protein n=1 Tax=Amycolatopsis minnesotensis TaxID=337894 RepID=A0ABP5E0Y7_9PSEU
MTPGATMFELMPRAPRVRAVSTFHASSAAFDAPYEPEPAFAAMEPMVTMRACAAP